jgi:hypothetical protein
MLRDLSATATRLHVRDDRETPLCTRRDARQMQLICGEGKVGYFLREGWTRRIGLMRFEKSAFASHGICVECLAELEENSPSNLV